MFAERLLEAVDFFDFLLVNTGFMQLTQEQVDAMPLDQLARWLGYHAAVEEKKWSGVAKAVRGGSGQPYGKPIM